MSMFTTVIIGAAAAISLLSGATRPQAARPAAPLPTPDCLPAAPITEVYRSWILQLVTDPTYSDKVEDDLPHISDTSEVFFIYDAEVCAMAARAEAKLRGIDTTSPPAVHVLRLGPTRYLVFNLRQEGAGRSLAVSLFDQDFKPRKLGR